MGFGGNYTAPVSDLPEGKDLKWANWKRHSLLGNAWHVGVTSFLMQSLLMHLVTVPADATNAHCGIDVDRACPGFAETHSSLRDHGP